MKACLPRLAPIVGLLLTLALVASPARADEVSVAVAANFSAPLQQLAAAFEKDSGHRVIASSGSTGKLYAQIRNGAPFDVLLSGDFETPARLVKEGFAGGASPFSYAIGKLVLWSPQPSVVDKQGAVLKKADFAHLALADPKLAPYGAAAVETLTSLGLLQSLQPRIVMAENISQAHQFVASGNATLGFVALSQVQKDGKVEGSVWLVPSQLYSPIRQDAVLLEKGRGKPAAEALMRYLKSDKARAIIQSFGYALP